RVSPIHCWRVLLDPGRDTVPVPQSYLVRSRLSRSKLWLNASILVRLCRLMCGRPSAFRLYSGFILGLCPKCLGHNPRMKNNASRQVEDLPHIGRRSRKFGSTESTASTACACKRVLHHPERRKSCSTTADVFRLSARCSVH